MNPTNHTHPMKHPIHLLSILALAVFALGDVGHATQDLQHPTETAAWHGDGDWLAYDYVSVDPAPVAWHAEVGAIELAYLPIEPAPARIEQARNRVPHITTASGYLRHAWQDPHRARRHALLAREICLVHRHGHPLRLC